LNAGPLVVALLSFLTYGYVSDTPLSADRAFSALTLFGILRLPLLILPVLTSALVSGRVSAERLSEFLSEPDLVDYRILQSASEPIAVKFQNAVLEWPGASDTSVASTSNQPGDVPAKTGDTTGVFRLQLQLQLPAGKLTQIVGSVGSGKTAVLSSLLGEMALVDGRVIVQTPLDKAGLSMAYCSQQPWIMNATLRENILFGQNFDHAKYAEVIDACALTPDLGMLPAGDQTEIGEKGINLSGGQKARVSLARAVYSDASIVLLDDVLSAVDAHVARHLFSRAIKHLLQHRTVIMVSHQVQFLPQADMVVVMHKGKAVQVGSYSTLMGGAQERAGRDDSLGGSNLLAEMMQERHRVDVNLSETFQEISPAAAFDADSNGNQAKVVAISKHVSSKLAADDVAIPVKPTSGKLILDEDRNRGSVPLSMYSQYLLQFGVGLLVVMVVSLAALNVGNVGVDWWLSYWADNPELHSVNYYVACYAGITAATTVVTFVQMFSWAYGGVAASVHFHAGMLTSIMRSPMRFFDSTPAGRILNRFSGDIEILDKQLPTTFQSFLQLGTRVASTVIVQAIVFPYTLLATGPILIMYIFLQRFYSHSSREIKRIDNITKSPVSAHLAESLSGLPTVRAYGSSARFVAISEARINANTIAYLKYNLINRWLGLRLDWLGSLLICVTCVVAVLQVSVDPGLIGLAISYAMTITNTLNWLVRNSSETETYLSSVQRVQHYSSLPSEKPAVMIDNKPSPAWPALGGITFDKLTLTYSPELPPVLQDVSVTILPGEKVGVCGRTGAGKSSLMLGLFRILEPTSGCIVIDGIDISTIGLKDLRSKLSIIPQDPVLFDGTLKSNLDPRDTHSDEQLMDAIASVQLAAFVSEHPDGLNMKISSGGESLSVGQRQLICMARSLLRKSKIMVLDEATASTDVASDRIIQQKLRELQGVTQLTIAHRINTIMDSDKILVLEAGRVLEFGSPSTLLANQHSAFAQLVRSSAAEANLLRPAAAFSPVE
jgi:ATP-binding cassette subfamily C (CFTR/MRP) protein 1